MTRSRHFFIVAQIGGGQMLYRVDGAHVQSRFAVGFLHAYVKGGDHLAAHLVLAAHIDATQQLLVVYRKTWYLLHISLVVVYLMLSRKRRVTPNELLARRSQKSTYMAALSSRSGTSLMMRIETKGTP